MPRCRGNGGRRRRKRLLSRDWRRGNNAMCERTKRCETCKWWLLVDSCSSSDRGSICECHRYPPILSVADIEKLYGHDPDNVDSDLMTRPVWQRTMPGDFCGEWKPAPARQHERSFSAYVAGKLREARAYAPGDLDYLAEIIVGDWDEMPTTAADKLPPEPE